MRLVRVRERHGGTPELLRIAGAGPRRFLLSGLAKYNYILRLSGLSSG